MRSTLSRLGGRLVTGPIAFALAGVVDVLAFTVVTARARARRRLG